MSEKQKHHLKKKGPELTPEQQAEALAALQKKQAEERAERERIELYAKSLSKMSFRQIRGELRRTVEREKNHPGLTSTFGVVLLTVLEGTKTKENPFGKLHAYPR